MTKNVLAVSPETSLETAARLFTARGISGAPVVREGKPIGVVTLADLVDPSRSHSDRYGYPLFYAMSPGPSLSVDDAIPEGNGQVADVMSPFVLSIEASARIGQAASMMVDKRVHRLLILERGELVGIITTLDLLRELVRAEVSENGL